MIEELISNRINFLEDDYRYFIDSSFSNEAALSFGAAENLSEGQIIVLENALTLYFLLFLDSDAAISFIERNCEISNETSTSLFWGIISTLPTGMEESIKTAYKALNGNPEKIIVTNQINPGLRTMPMDMQASVQHQQPPATPIPPPNIPTQNPPQGIPTYQSSQEAIFTPPTEAQQPYTPPTPRWDTDNRQ